jgi:hypothetical protein
MVAYFVVATFTHLFRKDWAALTLPLLFLAIFVGLGLLRRGTQPRFWLLLDGSFL